MIIKLLHKNWEKNKQSVKNLHHKRKGKSVLEKKVKYKKKKKNFKEFIYWIPIFTTYKTIQLKGNYLEWNQGLVA